MTGPPSSGSTPEVRTRRVHQYALGLSFADNLSSALCQPSAPVKAIVTQQPGPPLTIRRLPPPVGYPRPAGVRLPAAAGWRLPAASSGQPLPTAA